MLAGALATPTMACDLCAVYSASQAQGQTGAGWFGGAAEQFTHFGTAQTDGHRVPNPAGQYLDSSISQIFAGYNFTEQFGLQFNLPIIARSFERPQGFANDRGTVSGPGDVSLLGSLIAYRKLTEDYTFSWSVLGGLKFPTGDSSRIKEEFSEVAVSGAPVSGIHGHDLTLGTGSFDGIVGTGVFTRWQRLFLSANVQYAIRTRGDFDYQFANDLTWSGGPGIYLALNHKYTLALQAVVSGESKGKDTFQGAPADDTAVTAVYLGPQVSFTWGSNLSAQAGVDLPVSIDNSAFQIVPAYRVRAGLTWHF
ncbi:MAG: transporter family protein [Limisphaerales bacterium]